MPRIVPIRRVFENWRAALAAVTEDSEIEKLVCWIQPKDGEPHIITHDITRADMAYAGAMLVDEALYGKAVSDVGPEEAS